MSVSFPGFLILADAFRPADTALDPGNCLILDDQFSLTQTYSVPDGPYFLTQARYVPGGPHFPVQKHYVPDGLYFLKQAHFVPDGPLSPVQAPCLFHPAHRQHLPDMTDTALLLPASGAVSWRPVAVLFQVYL